MSTAVTLKGQRLFENDIFILLWSKGPFGLSIPLFTSFHVFTKHSQVAIKASGFEKTYLLACIAEWQRIGTPPKKLRDTNIFENFCEAVVNRQGARWAMFFNSKSPQETIAALRTYT